MSVLIYWNYRVRWCWKIFQEYGKEFWKANLEKKPGKGSRQSTIIPALSTETASRLENFVTNTYCWKCQTIFGTNLLYQFLESLEGMLQQLTMSFCPINMKIIQPPSSMETAYRLISWPIVTMRLTWDSSRWFWSRNWSKVVIREAAEPKKLKRLHGIIKTNCSNSSC